LIQTLFIKNIKKQKMIKFIKYEINFWLKSPMVWIFFLINAALVMGAVSSDNISIGGGVGSVHKNSPFVVQTYYGFLSMFCLLMTMAFMNATANRDFQHGMHQFVFSSPISKRDYFFGKFIGAYFIALIPMMGISLGALIGPFMPWAQPERYGDVIWSGHLAGFFGMTVPNVFISGVLLYGLAVIFRNNIVSFVGAMAILVFYIVSAGFTQDIEKEWLACLTDPFGFRPRSIVSKYLTIDEKNTSAVPLIGWFLYNRLIWVGTAILGLFGLYSRFSFSEKNKKAKREKVSDNTISSSATSFQYQPSMSKEAGISTLWSIMKFETFSIIKNNTFIILMLIGVINLGASLTSFTGSYGSTQYPVTYDIIDSIRGAFYLFLIGFITFYTGLIVWKERDAKINEIQDATPIKSSTLFLSKFFALCMSILIVMAMTILIGIIAQTFHGYTRYQLGVYVQSVLIWDFLGFIFLTAISLLFHYMINNRYIAYFAFVVFVTLNSFIWGPLQISTHLVKYASSPSMTYSDMNEYGPFLTSNIWFNLYWAFGAAIVLIVAYLFFIRGKEETFKYRWDNAKANFGGTKLYFGLGALGMLATGANIYYNTLALNKVTSSDENEQAQIYYEKNYKKYEGKAQPKFTDFIYKIDLYPAERNLLINAKTHITNKSNEVINELYFTLPKFDDSLVITIPGTKLKLRDDKHSFRIYSLDKPMQPGDTLDMTINNITLSKGFENEVGYTEITQNGTFFNSMDILPMIGYSDYGEISDKNKRVKFKLPKRSRGPKLNDNDLKARSTPYISQDADWVDVTTEITTSSDQTAVAPGSLINTSEKNGRKTFTYKLDKKSLNFYSFISAKYEVARKKWKGIDLEVYYHKDHAYNVPNMLKSMEKSLDYYTTNFGPYYHKQCRIVEFPRYAGFAQAFPGTMPYSESIGFITDLRDVTKDDIDGVFYVVAHEMGHQYWAHQLIGPRMQGSEMMSEGFAQYSALMVMEKEYGKDKMKKFLRYETDGYLAGRSSEFEAERPLVKTEGQGYIHYQKASAVLYYLKEMIGEEKVNGAMKSLIDSFAYKGPLYPTSNVALAAFKKATPDSLQYIIGDLFENITIFSNRVKDIQVKEKGKEYEVTINTISEKFYADSLGKETLRPLSDFIDVGIFTKGKDEDQLGKPLIYQRLKLTKKENTFTYTVKEKPYQAGIDPYNYLIDRIQKDNVKKVY
jgi:ABC-2 type transport system permease protein